MTIQNPMFPPLVPAASPTSRRSILFGLAAGVVASPAVASSLRPAVTAPAAETALSGLAPAGAGASEVDPIFALIAEHRAALKAYLAASAIDGRLRDHTPEWKAAMAVTRPAQDRERAANSAVFATDPTTLAGVVALLEHVGQPEFLVEDEEYPDDRQTLLSTLNDCGDELQRLGQDFPIRLAAAVRRLTTDGGAQS